MEQENIILYDWLSFTAKEDDPHYMVRLLGLEHCPWEITKGARGYQDRLFFNSISIHYHGRPDMGVWCEMSGQGCRAFETLTTLPNGWNDLFFRINRLQLNITRLDVAFDDHTGLLDMDTIILDTRKQEYVSKSEYWETVESSKGQTCMYGSPKSDVLIRIYDKARERNCAPGTHWIRCEMQLRDKRAKAFTELPLSIGEAFCGVVINYLRFVDPDPDDTNRWRWPIKEYWGEFLSHAEAIRLYKSPGLEYNLDRCERYVIGQAGNAIDAYIQAVGFSNFVRKLKDRDTQRNPKYDRMVMEYRNLKGITIPRIDTAEWVNSVNTANCNTPK